MTTTVDTARTPVLNDNIQSTHQVSMAETKETVAPPPAKRKYKKRRNPIIATYFVKFVFECRSPLQNVKYDQIRQGVSPDVVSYTLWEVLGMVTAALWPSDEGTQRTQEEIDDPLEKMRFTPSEANISFLLEFYIHRAEAKGASFNIDVDTSHEYDKPRNAFRYRSKDWIVSDSD